MKIEELRRRFADGEMDKKNYGKQMFQKYEELLSYGNLMKDSKVKEILINEEGVLFKMRLSSPAYDEYDVIMQIYRKDYAAVPNTVLSVGDYEPVELDMVSRVGGYALRERGGYFLI